MSTQASYEAYRRLYERLIKLFRPRMERALRKQVRVFTEAYEISQHVTRKIIPPEIIESSLKQLHITAGLNGAKLTAKEINRQLKGNDEEDSRWTYVINEYLKEYGLTQLSIEITQTLRERINAVLIKGNEEGWGVDKMVRTLNTASFPRWMATRIVRTETNKAANTGAMVAATDAGIELDKKWVSTQDNRTRRIPRDQYDHLDMNGRTVGFNERFIVPSTKSVDAMLYPGDPEASAGNLCNCRCRVVFVPKRDGEGNPIASSEHQPENPFKKLLDQAKALGMSLRDKITSLFKENQYEYSTKYSTVD